MVLRGILVYVRKSEGLKKLVILKVCSLRRSGIRIRSSLKGDVHRDDWFKQYLPAK
jgi:hypothetical protein